MTTITKVQAITQLIKNNKGRATWQELYENITRYYPEAKRSKEWQAGIRGVVYREIRNGKTFKQHKDSSLSLK